jgi:hypothetical protein
MAVHPIHALKVLSHQDIFEFSRTIYSFELGFSARGGAGGILSRCRAHLYFTAFRRTWRTPATNWLRGAKCFGRLDADVPFAWCRGAGVVAE